MLLYCIVCDLIRQFFNNFSCRCDNTIGSYACVRVATCGTGYTLNHNTGMCVDDDECRYTLTTECWCFQAYFIEHSTIFNHTDNF